MFAHCVAASVLALVLLAGCRAPNAAPAPLPVVQGRVQDLTEFERFVATRPTPAQFRSRYPDVVLVLPGDIATKEYRTDNSRYFAELDQEGRITGGKFM